MNKKRKLMSALCIFVGICMMLSGVKALAVTKPDTDKGISISLKYEYNNAPISGVRFNVYKVADLCSDGTFSSTPDFSKYSVDYDNLTAEKLKSLSDTLSAYIMRDNITPVSTAVTSESGYAAFAFSKKQTAGLYLIIGEKKEIGGFVYTPETLMISMPTLSDDGKTYIYDVVAVPKVEVGEVTKTTEIEVVKVWKNDSETNRPTFVTVQLMCDEEVFDEVTLNKDNNWRHTWTDLDIKHTWAVAEKTVPSGYKVDITHSGKNYIIVNTAKDESTTNPGQTTTNPSSTTKPNDKTTTPDKTTKPNKTTNPDITTFQNTTGSVTSTTNSSGTTGGSGGNSSTKATTVTTTKPPKKIPQTGMLEWPIPLMLEFGTAFVIIGIIFCVRKKDEDEK